ncbi:MAG TPA: FtsX-like permease family protein [Candidatus Acidoferrales bacterium]|nr:FtsX-like permease family protein [Candidatus Acidoferrales bacterium]
MFSDLWIRARAIFHRKSVERELDDELRFHLLVRSAAQNSAVVPAIRQAIWSVDKDAALGEPRTAREILASSVAEPRFRTMLLGAFGALGLLLALVGIYGAISYSVSSRTHEIGIRMALGAQRGHILRAVIGRGLLLSGAGIAIGIAGALAVTRLLRSLLFEVTPADPITFGGVVVLFAFVAVAACYVPARRATRVDPLTALRHE